METALRAEAGENLEMGFSISGDVAQQQSSGETEKVEERPMIGTHELIQNALRFAIWAAGEGFMGGDGVPNPDDFLFEFCKENDIDDWDELPDRILSVLK